MKSYQHTQGAPTLVITLIAAALVSGITAAFCPPLLVMAAILILMAWLLHSLTIEITAGELRWWIGPGWIRGHAALSEIGSVRVVRTWMIDGWGVHYGRFGWLYNVGGFDAVAIVLRNGRRICLGSDEPDKLAERLSAPKPGV